ncbi:unnamed protein product [Phytomonas sp. EM1]|nr:unnamed protein product [Phytomonas sp. EM1]|eukprot:CCW65325.1 unnamed protein product [Phytomonas sp. isolate EM1]
MSIKNADEQESLLSRLHWLIERSKNDFKGNPPPFEQPKDRKLVEREKQRRANVLAAPERFLPFHHAPKPLALDATRIDYLKGVDNTKFRTILLRKENSTKQKVDPETGLIEIQAALCWNIKPRSKPLNSDVRSQSDQHLKYATNGIQNDVARHVRSSSPQKHIVGHIHEVH